MLLACNNKSFIEYSITQKKITHEFYPKSDHKPERITHNDKNIFLILDKSELYSYNAKSRRLTQKIKLAEINDMVVTNNGKYIITSENPEQILSLYLTRTMKIANRFQYFDTIGIRSLKCSHDDR